MLLIASRDPVGETPTAAWRWRTSPGSESVRRSPGRSPVSRTPNQQSANWSSPPPAEAPAVKRELPRSSPTHRGVDTA